MDLNDRIKVTRILSKISMEEWSWFLASDIGSTIATRLDLARAALRDGVGVQGSPP
jgi:hypothetical protein